MSGHPIDPAAPIPLDEARKRKASRSAKAPRRPEPGDERPVIRLTVGRLEQVVDEAERALIAAERGVYQRSNIIVGIGAAPIITADQQRILAKQILPLGDHRILELLMSAAHFEKWDARADAFVPANAAMTVVKALEQRRGAFRLPPLTGLINAPTMRSDGSLLTVPGYDAATGLLYDPGDEEFPKVPDQPDRAAAETALQSLEDLIGDFPFVADADRSVTLAAMLTASCRRSVRTAPAFLFDAPVAGSGKSKLVDIASVMASGREAGVISLGRDEAETEKRLASLLLSGSPIAIDNVEAGLGGDLLCQLLTQTSVRMRVLGRSETPELPTSVLVTVTGNNLVLVGDMTRRALICRLDPGVERPELREFAFEPVGKAKAARGAYLVDALTVLRAYHVAGRPRQTGPLGSFEEWSDLIRGALVWLGRADPVSTMEQGRAGDPQLESLRTVMHEWRRAIGIEQIAASDLAQRASERERSFIDDGKAAFRHPALREALLGVAGEGGFINIRRLGKWLGKNKDRVIDGLRFEVASSVSGVARWHLREWV